MRKDDRWEALVYVAVLSLVLGIWVVGSYFEARTYNRVTGSDLTTLDAMFVTLLVEGSAGNGR